MKDHGLGMQSEVWSDSTGGPCILWFLVPKGYVFSIKLPNGSKECQRSPFWAYFCKILVLKDWNNIT